MLMLEKTVIGEEKVSLDPLRWKLRSLMGGFNEVHDMLLPNMASCHIEYFKLKDFEKTAEVWK